MEIYIRGHHITHFGELWDRTLKELLYEAMEHAVRRAGLKPTEIEAVFVANKAAGEFVQQRHLNAIAAQFFEHHPPAMRVEGACASGGLAVMAAEDALLSGRYQTVLVVGVEKMTDVASSETTRILATAADADLEYGSTFPALYALLANVHMDQFGTTREQLSAVAVKNHHQAMNNPQAQYHREFTLEQVSASTLVADPLRLLDCSPITDGAAAVVLSTQPATHFETNSETQPNETELNETQLRQQAVIIGRGHAQDSLDLARRQSLTELVATTTAARQAYQEAEVEPKDIQIAEVHDCFTIAELLAIEDLGFVAKGEGGSATLAESVGPVINHSGGLKACGHPVGATGVKQLAYVAQLIESGEFELGLTHNVGGSGATAVVHILSGVGETHE